jgi:hypothetical protein
MPTSIDTEEQVDRTFAAQRAEGAVEALVAMFCATPNGILDGAVDVILRIALYDEYPSTFKIPVKLFRVIAVGCFQFLKDRVGLYTRGRSRLGVARRVTVIAGPSTLPKCGISVARGNPAGLGWLLRVLILWLGQRGRWSRKRLSYLLGLWDSLGGWYLLWGGRLRHWPLVIPGANVHVMLDRWRRQCAPHHRPTLCFHFRLWLCRLAGNGSPGGWF